MDTDGQKDKTILICVRFIIIIIAIIIIIGSTALRGPWPSTEASGSGSIQLLLLQIS
jgi:hypothetical protein